MSGGNDSILDMFLYETNTLLEQLDSIVLTAEQVDEFSQDDVNEIFRIMHTIKGSSAMMEFGPLMSTAHRIEDLFFIIRENSMAIVQTALRPVLFDLLFQSIDYFRSEVKKLENGLPFSEDIDSFLEKINSLILKIQSGDSGVASAEPAAGDMIPDASDEIYPFGLRIFFEEGSGMEHLRAYMLIGTVRDICSDGDFTFEPADAANPSGEDDTIAESGLVLRFISDEERDHVLPLMTTTGSIHNYQIFDDSIDDIDPVFAPEDAPAQVVAPTVDAPVAAASKSVVPKAAAAKAADPNVQQHAKESLISVNLSKLDQLMAVVGEIVITESMVTSCPELKSLKLDTFTKSARQLRKLTDELQDVSMSLRMVPVSGTFQKMNRIVRDMSKKLGKQVRLTLLGEDTEVDKTIVDSISDPIMHIVRNSMDHGIEATPEDRIAAGKNPVGEIILSARHTGSEVIIEIKDNGGGVDCDHVLAKAIRQGLASADIEYSQREILNFLMMPGFSTNAEVTEFSGRGVGMDVVKRNVEDVGGTVSIASERGKGMVTTLKIPLTMAIMDGMEVSVGDSIFTIPINNIRQSFKVASDMVIHDAHRGEIIKCMDNFYPIVRVKSLYQLESGFERIEDGIVLWVDSGDRAYCLFVDELIGEQQVVVKPLPTYVNAYNIKNYGISGCTILGDGNISIILDISNLYSAVQKPGM